MARDIHSNPFDEGTIIKLELFKLYLREWLPVFIMQNKTTFEIYDFFAGEGCDSIGVHGSPLIILDELKIYCSKLSTNHTNVVIHLNDIDQRKIEKLKGNIESAIKNCALGAYCPFHDIHKGIDSCPFSLNITHENFVSLFDRVYPGMYKACKTPRFIFLDQYGIKYVNNDVFNKLVSLKFTDFLFFISSSHLVRFKDQPEFSNYLNTNTLDFTESRPAECHRVIYNYFKTMLDGQHFYLGQFSIKKESNYYGLIFGSQHPLGIKKFLDVAWRIDPHTGETNHNIDSDSVRNGTLEFDFEGTGEVNRIKKLTAYEHSLMNYLRIPRTNKNIFLFSLENGICISKTTEILKKLEKSGKLAIEGEQRQKGGFYLDYNPIKNIRLLLK